MLDKDIPRGINVPHSLQAVAAFLDAYNLSIGVTTDYHAGKHDSDVRMFCVYAPAPAKDFSQTKLTVGIVPMRKKKLRFGQVYDFQGRKLPDSLSPEAFTAHITELGDRLETHGYGRERLAEFYHLVTAWDTQRESRARQEDALAALDLPFELYDKRAVVQYGSHMLADMLRVVNMPAGYLADLFNLEALREQDIAYAAMKRHGRRHPGY